jgi:hypothetical protein
VPIGDADIFIGVRKHKFVITLPFPVPEIMLLGECSKEIGTHLFIPALS